MSSIKRIIIILTAALLATTAHTYITTPTVEPLSPAEPCAVMQPIEAPTEPATLAYYVIDRPAEPEPYYPLQDWERALICRVLMSECPYEPSEGQRAVAQVILDRLMSPDYPNTVYEVLTQSGQFAAPSEVDVLPEISEAVAAVFDAGERVTESEILYFYAPRYGISKWHEEQDYELTIKNHKFYS